MRFKKLSSLALDCSIGWEYDRNSSEAVGESKQDALNSKEPAGNVPLLGECFEDDKDKDEDDKYGDPWRVLMNFDSIESVLKFGEADELEVDDDDDLSLMLLPLFSSI